MSGSIFHNDQTGVLGVVVGLIAMVMFGVLVTLLADGSISFGGPRTSDAEAAVLRQEKRITELTSEIGGLIRKAEKRKELQAAGEKVKTTRSALETAGEEAARHRSVLAADRAAIAAMEKDFAQYREDYRHQVWRNAPGTKLGRLVTVDGKSYEDATVKSVSELGIVVSHRAGLARLAVSNLPKALHDRFLLDAAVEARIRAEEQERRQAEEQRRRERMRPPEQPEEDQDDDRYSRRKPSSRDKQPEMDAATRARVTELHRELARLQSAQGRIRSDLATARSNASGYGRDRSVPGSLDTWGERAAKLQRAESKVTTQLNLVQAELAEKDPAFRRLLERRR